MLIYVLFLLRYSMPIYYVTVVPPHPLQAVLSFAFDHSLVRRRITINRIGGYPVIHNYIEIVR